MDKVKVAEVSVFCMEIKGFVDISLVDWDEKVSSTIFLANCNMRCPFCYNAALVLHPEKLRTIPFEEIAEYLERNREWLDGVVITGGEPTIHSDLPNLCEKIKKLGFAVKIDTNGTNPTLIRELINKKLVDYIALDIKAPLEQDKYYSTIGINTPNLLNKISETISILQTSQIDYEFRTTLVPTIHKEKDIEEICQRIRNCKKYVLQNYKTDVETVNPSFSSLKPFSQEELKTFLKIARKIIPNTILRDNLPK
jgi:pyruvate formate lyase activating enzyme